VEVGLFFSPGSAGPGCGTLGGRCVDWREKEEVVSLDGCNDGIFTRGLRWADMDASFSFSCPNSWKVGLLEMRSAEALTDFVLFSLDRIRFSGRLPDLKALDDVSL